MRKVIRSGIPAGGLWEAGGLPVQSLFSCHTHHTSSEALYLLEGNDAVSHLQTSKANVTLKADKLSNLWVFRFWTKDAYYRGTHERPKHAQNPK